MTINEFSEKVGFRPTYKFYMKVILPMYKAAPDTIDIKLFCKMFTRQSLEIVQNAYLEKEGEDDDE